MRVIQISCPTVLALVVLITPVCGQAPNSATHWWGARRLSGEWGGRRADLEDLGLDFSLFLNHYVGLRMEAGEPVGSRVRPSASVDLFLEGDLERMGLTGSGEVLLQVKSNHGHNINRSVGAVSDPVDDADFNEWAYISQFYYQQTVGEGTFQFRVGYLDQQTILDRNRYANSEDKQFLSTLLDNNNAIVPLKIGLGATLFVHPSEWVTLTLGTADAENRPRLAGFSTALDDFTSLMAYGQIDLHPQLPGFTSGSLEGHYRFGLFHDPTDKTVFSPGGTQDRTESGDTGFYLSFDQTLIADNASHRSLGAFCRYGQRRGDRNKVSRAWSAGLQYQGLFSERGGDSLGIGLYSAHGSEQFRESVAPDFRRETGLEFYYRLQLNPWLAITPDFQYIHNPGALISAPDAYLLVVRARVAL